MPYIRDLTVPSTDVLRSLCVCGQHGDSPRYWSECVLCDSAVWLCGSLCGIHYTLGLKQNGRHFADIIFKCIFVNENVWILNRISLKFVPEGLIDNTSALVHVMAWCRTDCKSLSQPMIAQFIDACMLWWIMLWICPVSTQPDSECGELGRPVIRSTAHPLISLEVSALRLTEDYWKPRVVMMPTLLL